MNGLRLIRYLLLIVFGAFVFIWIAFATYMSHWWGPRIPPDQIARRAMTLPAQARVISAELGDFSGDATIVFTLPPNKSVNAWFPIIWHMNHVWKNVPVTKSTWKWMSVKDDESRSLTYDPATGQYRYEIVQPPH